MPKDSVIYDYETLSKNRHRGVILCVAAIRFNEARYLSNDPYTYKELLNLSNMMKFSVADQVQSYNRVIDKDTLDWWSNQSSGAKTLLRESDSDVSIREIETFF